MRAALAQVTPVPRGIQENLARARAMLSESRDADVLVLPELFLSGYELTDAGAVAIELDGPEVGELRTAAGEADTALVVGAAERIANGVANSALLIDRRGDLAGVYRKTHLFGAENDAYTPGDELTTVKLDGRVVGPMICFDAEFPEVARTLTVRGAELLVTISANPVEFRLDHEVLVTARALESGLAHVYCNRVGRQDGISFAGDSIVVDPEGRVLAAAGPDVESTITAELPEPGRSDARTRYTELMRPSLYQQPG
jgi:predicted amidohydrolase